jgi:HEPN domain-containing protein
MIDSEGPIGLEATALERGATEKLAAARVLLHAGYPSDAYYLAGYAIEFALKSIIARRFRAATIPDLKLVRQIYSHDLDALARQAGVLGALEIAAESDRALRDAWTIARTWNVDVRYGHTDFATASEYIEAIGGGDDQQGLLGWLRSKG